MSTPTKPLTPTQDALRRLTTLTRLDKIVLGVLALAAMAIAFTSLGAYMAGGDDEHASQTAVSESAKHAPSEGVFSDHAGQETVDEFEFTPRVDMSEQATVYGVTVQAMRSMSPSQIDEICTEWYWDPVYFADQVATDLLAGPEFDGYSWGNVKLAVSQAIAAFC